jgi:hypothetical protein
MLTAIITYLDGFVNWTIGQVPRFAPRDLSACSVDVI